MALKLANKRSVTLLLVILLVAATMGYIAAKVIQYKTYIWLPNYYLDSHANDIDNMRNGHVIFMIADHHEPGHGERGFERSLAWSAAYRKNVAGIVDDYGNPVQYTWFYPFDHMNSRVVLNLNEMVFEGLGEVEFHWHHGPDTNETFPPKLAEALAWFNSHGCLLSVGESPAPQFGFVHGNWALDNSRREQKYCGVNRELDILREYGCYADFTFATLSTVAQPSMINRIFYAQDSEGAKSYDRGHVAEVGKVRSDFMIFQGPICCDWQERIWECAALESTSPFKAHRIGLWLKFAPIVKGRSDWLFVKVYTHGSQSRDVILSSNFREMLTELKRVCQIKGLSLHFVTAREAYNIVKAAEAGRRGNPEGYRDYLLPKPVNRIIRVAARVRRIMTSEGKANIELLTTGDTSFLFKTGKVQEISGFLSRYQYGDDGGDNPSVTVEGEGPIRVRSKTPLEFKNKVVGYTHEKDYGHVYVVEGG